MIDKRLDRLKEIRSELFDIANSYGGDVTGCVAGNLHNASNRVSQCIRMLETGISPEDERNIMAEWLAKQPIFL